MKAKTGSKPTSEASFEEVYRTYYKGCLAFIASSYPKLREEEVEDICSETMIKAFRSFSCYDPEKGSITTWLFRIAINAAKDHFSDQKKQPTAAVAMPAISDEDQKDGYEPDIADPDTKTPIDMLVDVENEAKKNANIERLDEMQREIVLMREEGRRYKEISERLGIPETTARTKFRRAMLRLKKMMASSDEIGE